MDINKLLRPHLLNIKPYSSARDEYKGREGIFLDANENPFGSGIHENFNRYPDPLQTALKQKISQIKGVNSDNIFLGNGSDEPIDLLIRAFCEPGKDNIIIAPPTYGMYNVSADINGVKTKKAPLTSEFLLDEKAIVSAIDQSTKLVFLCSPNNPTGNSMQEDAIERILKNFRGLVIIDEAYIDFSAQKSFSQKLGEFNNLVVLQTLSKAWGLAALRLGMAFCHAEIVEILNKIKPPYNINGATQKLAHEALNNQNWKDQQVREILNLRRDLEIQLGKLEEVIKIYPSDANFLLVEMKDVKSAFKYLIDQKIIVRDRSNLTLCEGCLRITIGTANENQQLTEALTKFDSK